MQRTIESLINKNKDQHLHWEEIHWIPELQGLQWTWELQTRYVQELLLLAYHQAKEPQLPNQFIHKNICPILYLLSTVTN